MASSYRQIHYVMRPAKNVERKMISDVVARLARLTAVSEMTYVGLGSVYFADFSAFHRRLGFTEMHSIENVQDTDVRRRFEFNRPYDTKLHFQHTNDALPNLDWDKPCFVWLDYDERFSGWMLDDINTVVSSAHSPSIFAITVNVEPGDDEGRYSSFFEQVGVELLPDTVTNDASLGGKSMGNAVRDVIDQAVSRTLADRNGVLGAHDKFSYIQLFNFRYSDNARMLTVGGLLFENSASDAVEACDFGAFPFVMVGGDSFEITVPNLTLREALHLDSQLPSKNPLQAAGIPSREKEAYARLYRYLPSFVDADY
jgi:hypothetical protein